MGGHERDYGYPKSAYDTDSDPRSRRCDSAFVHTIILARTTAAIDWRSSMAKV